MTLSPSSIMLKSTIARPVSRHRRFSSLWFSRSMRTEAAWGVAVAESVVGVVVAAASAIQSVDAATAGAAAWGKAVMGGGRAGGGTIGAGRGVALGAGRSGWAPEKRP